MRITRYSPIRLYPTAPLYNIFIIYDTVGQLGRKETVNTKNNEFNRAAIFRLWLCRGQINVTGIEGSTLTVGHLKIALSEQISLLLHPHVPTFREVWLLHNLTLNGKLCLMMTKNAAFFFYKFTAIVMAGEQGQRHTLRAHNPQANSDWMNPLFLGTTSAFGCIANSV